MKPIIIVMNGKPRTGKTTVGEIMKNMFDICINRSSIDLVKEAATVLGWDGEKNPKSRQFLSDLKMISTAFNDASFNDIHDKYTELCEQHNQLQNRSKDEIHSALIVDIREPEEIEKLVTRYGHDMVVTIFVEKDELNNVITGNDSDDNVEEYDYDICIKNDGTLSDLYRTVKQIHSNVIKSLSVYQSKSPSSPEIDKIKNYAISRGCNMETHYERRKTMTIIDIIISYKGFFLDIHEDMEMINSMPNNLYFNMIKNKIDNLVNM